MTDFVATDSIWIDRENRQRKVITIDDLIPSVAKHGILQPILINADHKLMAGERRLTTALHLGLTEVPVRFFENLSEIEQQLVELEENMRRRDLTWQETCLAVLSIDRLHKVEDPEWTIDQTCVSVGLARRSVENYLKIGKALEDEDENITKADTLSAAITIHTRRSQREQDAAAAKLLDAKRTPTPEVSAPKAVSVQPGMSTEGFREIPQTQPSEAVPVEALSGPDRQGPRSSTPMHWSSSPPMRASGSTSCIVTFPTGWFSTGRPTRRPSRAAAMTATRKSTGTSWTGSRPTSNG